ncbi:MAG: hypothetical protein NDJ90_11395 [Oligoflexia bacterium]|nr:hypothetical protein [Oligoflexia bacterium]
MSRLQLLPLSALSLISSTLAASSGYAEVYHGQVSLTGQHFATDAAFSPKVSLDGEITSDENLDSRPRAPKGEFHLFSFFEGDANVSGDVSIDIDSTALRGAVGEHGHFWFGRVQPLTEGTREKPFRNTSAIGTNWVQNQANALDPRISGWIGGGLHLALADTGLFSTVALSPVYLPTFGPRLDFSDKAETRGSRFAKLPPLYYSYNGELFPMRYQINTGSMKAIVLQNQYLFALGHESTFHRLTGLFWSAPAPDPQVTTSGKLQVNSETGVNVMVSAVPSFPRENFLGFRWELRGIFAKPDLSLVHELRSHRTTLSASAAPLSYLELGWLHSLLPAAALAPDATGVVTPRYARALVWGEINAPWKLSPSLRVEHHLTEGQRGVRLSQGLSFQATQKLLIAWRAEILAGDDGGYFGAWKSLDSVSLGARYQW